MSLPLHVACSAGKKNSLKKIIDSVPVRVLERRDENGRTPLIISIAKNQIDCATLLLKAGVHVDNSDNEGQTALHIAANKGFHRCMKLLLSYNASCQQKDFFGVTPLHLAAIQTNSKCLSVVLKEIKPGEVDIQDSSKKTALHWCAAYSNIENTKNLLLKGANICIPDDDGRTPLHWAVIGCKSQALECVKILLEKEGSLINWQDYEGRSALHLAVATGSAEVVRFLACREYCNVDILDNAFCTPLHWAARKGLYDKVSILLNGRAYYTSADDSGASPLHYAAYNNHAKTVEVFLLRSYVCDVEDANGRNALFWAAARNADDVVQVMASSGVNLMYGDKNGVTALHAAAIQGHISTVELLLKLQVPIDLKDKYGMTPLLRACEIGRSKTALALVNYDADIDAQDVNKRSTLHWCALGGHAYLCQALLQKGAKYDAQDAFGMSPLHYASTKKGFLNCVSILLEADANPNIADGEGKTPLHWAVISNHLGVVRLLCEYDANVNAMALEKHWITPLDLAMSSGNVEMIKLLRKYDALTGQEIEEIAASKIQVWYLSHRSHKNIFFKFEGIPEREEDLITNSAILRRCQSIINTCQVPNFTNEENISVSSQILLSPWGFNGNTSTLSQMLQEKYFGNIDPEVWAKSIDYATGMDLNVEAKAASVIQEAWRKYAMKARFKRMRKNIQSIFEADHERVRAEILWQLKLKSFFKQW